MTKVYIRVNAAGKVTGINSDIFLKELEGWQEIDEGEGERYVHAQGNYLEKAIINEMGIFQYKYEDGKVVERTAEEMAAEEAAGY